jgi:ribonuclease BN (tRNA processing enzyme)
MKVTILGSGTCVPSLKRSSCSVLVVVNNQKIVIDCGAGTMRRLLRAGTTISGVTHLFFSHFHPDHTAELVPFLFASKYPEISRRKTPLYIVGGKGLVMFYESLRSVYGEWIDIGSGLLSIIELRTDYQDSRSFNDFIVDSMPVNHREESIAYRITSPNGTSVVYSGDTDVCESLVDIAQGADLFICESAMPDDSKVDGHLTPSLAGEIASRANVEKLVLIHLYPECDRVDIGKECRKTYQGQLVLAEDLMSFKLA